jgi:hypothetical protein
MKLLTATCLLSLFIGIPHVPNLELATSPDRLFDQYGAIRWPDEQARLDNFAIALQQDEKLVGYILVFDSVGGCAGEAQARAIRAKRYVVEYRGIPWNRVIWRVEGYLEGISTFLQPAPPEIVLPYPFFSTRAPKDGPPTRACRSRLQRIRRSRGWTRA